MARLIREKDWTTSPLGPIDIWSPALRSAVGICLGSRFPMVLYWGPTRALIYNDAWSTVPGQKHPWALGTPGYEVWAEIWDIIGPMFDHVMETGEATWSDDQLLPLNRFGYAEECYFYYSYSPVRGEDGTVEGIFTAVTETTYRVLAERRERLLREISEVTNQARTGDDACVAAIERAGTMPEEAPFLVAYVSEEAGQYRRVALVGEIDDVSAPDRLNSAHAPWPFHDAVSGPIQLENVSEVLGRTLAGNPWPENIEQALVVPIAGGKPDKPYGFLVAGISPRRRLNPDYITLFERISGHISTAVINAEAYAEEKRRAEQLAALDRAKTAFFSNASHEFRTPLTLMLGPIDDMLAVGTPSDDALTVSRDSLELVRRNGQRLLRLVNTLLDFSRLEAGRAKAQFEAVPLAEFTAELASSFRSAMQKAGLDFVIETPSLPEPVWVDKDMWEKIVLNLISNAFKYTLEGSVTVRLRSSTTQAVLEVRDTGVGIPEAELPVIFDRFHRIEGQKGRTHEGTGIGLALVRDLSELHGGTVSVTSAPDQGTTFTVAIPFGRDYVASNADISAPLASTAVRAKTFVDEAMRWLPDAEIDASLATPAHRRETILLADDNADMRSYVERLLTEAGYTVEAVADGQIAVDRALAAPPTLVLSDVMMPVLDGFGVVARLRANVETADIPIILLSARAGEEASIEGLNAGADDYLVKPFSSRELIARVEGAVRLAKMRRQAKDALQGMNEQLEQRVAERTRERDRSWTLSRDLIGVANSDGVWLSVNPAWTRLLGWQPDEIVGRSSEWLEHPDDRVKTRAEVATLARGETTVDFENRFRARNGEYRYLTWTAVPEDGYLYCIARDVTAERERSHELEAAREALRQAQKMEAIGQLTGGIAHDFNNMLSGVIGSLDLITRRLGKDADERLLKYVQAGTTSAHRAAGLTQRLLAFGRRQSLEVKPVDINMSIEGMEDLLRRALGENVKLIMALESNLWNGSTDGNQFESAILNLAINARDAMPEGGTLTITTKNTVRSGEKRSGPPPGEYVEVIVADTGEGMPPDVLEKVFEPFFTTKPIGKGSGLGLSMIYGYVQQTEGHIDVESEPGKGTTFSILVPRAKGGAHVDEVTPAIVLGGGQTVLVVEDEPEVRMIIVDVLEELGYQSIQAANAPEALDLLRATPDVELMVSDVGLPGMSGRRLVDEARLLKPGMKVLLITGYAAEAANRTAFTAGNIDMMTKPFAIEALAEKVQTLLKGKT